MIFNTYMSADPTTTSLNLSHATKHLLLEERLPILFTLSHIEGLLRKISEFELWKILKPEKRVNPSPKGVE